MPIAQLLEHAINETLSRTMLTVVTTMLALLALFIFGGEVIRSFTAAMLFGIVFGTYSSIFIAAPLLILFQLRPGSASRRTRTSRRCRDKALATLTAAMAEGIVIREAHFPGRAPIDAYGNGGFRFADMSHRGSLLCLPSGIYGWEPKDPLALTSDDFARVLRRGRRDRDPAGRHRQGIAADRRRRCARRFARPAFRPIRCRPARRCAPSTCCWPRTAPSPPRLIAVD